MSKEILWGCVISALIYLALPDVGLSKPQTLLILLVGVWFSTEIIYWIEDRIESRNRRRKGEEFRKHLNRTTL